MKTKLLLLAISLFASKLVFCNALVDIKKAKAGTTVNCFKAVAKGKESSATAVAINIGSNTNNIVIGGMGCSDITQTAVASIGKSGDLLIFASLPNEKNKNFFPVGSLKNIPLSLRSKTIVMPENLDDGILISYIPTEGELAGATIEFLIKRTQITDKMARSLSNDVKRNVSNQNDRLYTYYRRIQMPRRPEVKWLELSYGIWPANYAPTDITITPLDNGNAIVAYPAGVALEWQLGIKDIVPLNEQRDVTKQEE